MQVQPLPGEEGEPTVDVFERAEHLALPNSPVKLGMAVVWQFTIVAAFYPMLPIYLTGLGVSASSIALLVAILSITALLSAQVLGYIADTMMKRTTLLLVMTVMAAAIAGLFPLLPPGFWWLALGMVAMSVFYSQRVMILNSLLLDSERGEELYGRIRMLGSISFAVAAVIIGRLADMPSLTATVMWPALVFCEICFFLSILLLKDAAPKERLGESKRIGFREAQRVLLANPLIGRFLVFTLLYQFLGAPPHMLQTKYLADIGTSAMFATACVAFAALSEVVIFFFGNAILARVRLMPLLALVPICLGIRNAMVFLGPVDWSGTPWLIFASNGLHMITFGLAYMSSVLFIHREAPRELKSSAQTLFGLAFSVVAVFAGNLLLGALLNWLTTGPGGPGMADVEALRLTFGVSAVVCVLSLIAWFPMKRAYEKKHQVSGLWVKP